MQIQTHKHTPIKLYPSSCSLILYSCRGFLDHPHCVTPVSQSVVLIQPHTHACSLLSPSQAWRAETSHPQSIQSSNGYSERWSLVEPMGRFTCRITE